MCFPHSQRLETTLTAEAGLVGHLAHHLASFPMVPGTPRWGLVLPHSHLEDGGPAGPSGAARKRGVKGKESEGRKGGKRRMHTSPGGYAHV